MKKFTHLHLHTQYSILDGASRIPELLGHAKDMGMEAVAITDHGNMFGVKLFHVNAKKAGVKPILGCEVYLAPNGRFVKNKESRKAHHLILLAKNKTGYHNLTRMVSYGWTEGRYYKPRIDKELLEKYNEGIICSSACLGGEIPQIIMKEIPARDHGEVTDEEFEKAVEAAIPKAEEYKEIFGEDFYLEMQRHETGDIAMDRKVYFYQMQVNKILIEVSKRTGIKLIATNDVHFTKKDDALAHDRLICLNTGKDLDDPNRMKYTYQEYMKSPEEMYEIFKDIPEACENTQEIFEKIEEYELDIDPVMPDFPLPEGFENESDYLRHITYEGAKMRWGDDFTGHVKERVDFELDTIIGMGFPGYFLIVWDFIRAGREGGIGPDGTENEENKKDPNNVVAVGPGRGSAAGSAVAYCLQITEIDPVKYNLLFERFLNPDRISMPDIDIDFDEEGREKVLKYVVKKYGEKRVSHIVTFGTMAPKMAIKDVARVQKLELAEANRLAKLIPDKPGTTFKKALDQEPLLQQEFESDNELIKSTLQYAKVLEGSVRQTGVHACGIIICRDDLEEHIPVYATDDLDLLVTQYDGKHVENVGMLKMDFLGLKTLSIIKDAVNFIKEAKGIDVDIANVDLEDKETYELYSRGDTTGLFQFESAGMKKYLRELKPNRFEDLIAMNALYRPGPLEYIPSFINRKHGREEIVYDIPEMEEYLKESYGITVYQEQVMLLSQKLAGFTKGMADSLRKAMGKKIKAMMDDLSVKFEEGCAKKGYDPKVVKKVWKDWEAFAQYAFNKSHSTCYAFVAYQTGYLKAHYPSEFMAAVLSRNLGNSDKIQTFMDECKRMGLNVKNPNVNESRINFSVNERDEISFGLGAIKGVGDAAASSILNERIANGPYLDIFDFVERVNLRTVNKKNIECLCMSGGLDCFGIERWKYFADMSDGSGNFIESIIRYGGKIQEGKNGSSAPSLFGDTIEVSIPKPKVPNGTPWPNIKTLSEEKKLIGIYLSAHPLDDYRLLVKHSSRYTISSLENMEKIRGKEVIISGLVTTVKNGKTKTGKDFCSFILEDYKDSREFALFGKDYVNFSKYLYEGNTIQLRGIVDGRWGNPNNLDYLIQEVQFIKDLDAKISTLSLKIKIEDLNNQLIEDLHSFSEDFSKGGLKLNFLIYDPKDKVWIESASKTRKVKLENKDFVTFLEENEQIDFKLS